MSNPSDVLRNRTWTISKTGSDVLIQCENADDARAVFDWLTEFASLTEKKDDVVPMSEPKKKLPFFLDREPQVANTHAVLATVKDHLGESDVMITTWWNDEGFTIDVEDLKHSNAAKRSMEISWNEWDALRRCVKASKEAKKIKA